MVELHKRQKLFNNPFRKRFQSLETFPKIRIVDGLSGKFGGKQSRIPSKQAIS